VSVSRPASPRAQRAGGVRRAPHVLGHGPVALALHLPRSDRDVHEAHAVARGNRQGVDHGTRRVRMAGMAVMKKASAWLAAARAGAGSGQRYPAKPVKTAVPCAPGGTPDVTARLVAESMGKQLGQPFIVETRAGAGGALGSEAVAKPPPDGSTLVAGTTATT